MSPHHQGLRGSMPPLHRSTKLDPLLALAPVAAITTNSMRQVDFLHSNEG
jgi:hypothetical protein